MTGGLGIGGYRALAMPLGTVTLLLAVLLLAVACGDDATPQMSPTLAPAPTETATPEPASTPTPAAATPTPSPTRLPTPTATPTATAVAPTPTPVAAPVAVIGRDTTWGEFWGTLTEAERHCVETQYSGPPLSELMELPIVANQVDTTELELLLLGCLELPAARAFLFDYILADILDVAAPSESELACLQEVVSEIDPADVAEGDETAVLAFSGGFARCTPDLFISLYLGEDISTLDEHEADCLRAIVSTIDAVLLESLAGEDGDAEGLWEFLIALEECAPDVFGSDAEPPGIPDDHADYLENATPVEVGEAVPAMLEYDHDWDYFVFSATAGQMYLIDTALGTLEDSMLELFNARHVLLVSADDFGTNLAAHLYWQAPETGEYYAGVGGYGEGDYTFSVTVSDVEDDHANSITEATAVEPGMDAPGRIDYSGDVDYFRLQATEGALYRIETALGTLEDSVLRLYDAEGELWDSNDDNTDGLAARLDWQAPDAGPWYIAVSGYGGGSYTLSVHVADIDDDHGDSSEKSTEIEIEQEVTGRIDYEGDIDYFVFNAVGGVKYDLVTGLGSLEDSILELFDRQGAIEYNDDYSGHLAARIQWQAPIDGIYWVAVGGLGVGSYTLTIRNYQDSATTPSTAWQPESSLGIPLRWESIVDHLPILEVTLTVHALNQADDWKTFLSTQCHVDHRGPGSGNDFLISINDEFEDPEVAEEAGARNLGHEVEMLVEMDGWERPEIRTWRASGNSEQFSPTWLLTRTYIPWGYGDGLSLARDLVENDAKFLRFTFLNEDSERVIEFDTTGAPEFLGPLVETCVGK